MLLALLVVAGAVVAAEPYIPTDEELAQGDVEIVAGENKTVYEYRVNGRLMMIKVVPNVGSPYYMVPADGSAHYTDLNHTKKLYPRWTLL